MKTKLSTLLLSIIVVFSYSQSFAGGFCKSLRIEGATNVCPGNENIYNINYKDGSSSSGIGWRVTGGKIVAINGVRLPTPITKFSNFDGDAQTDAPFNEEIEPLPKGTFDLISETLSELSNGTNFVNITVVWGSLDYSQPGPYTGTRLHAGDQAGYIEVGCDGLGLWGECGSQLANAIVNWVPLSLVAHATSTSVQAGESVNLSVTGTNMDQPLQWSPEALGIYNPDGPNTYYRFAPCSTTTYKVSTGTCSNRLYDGTLITVTVNAPLTISFKKSDIVGQTPGIGCPKTENILSNTNQTQWNNKWYVITPGGPQRLLDGGVIGGAKTNTLILTNPTADNNGLLYQNVNGCVSNTLTLNYSFIPPAPSITGFTACASANPILKSSGSSLGLYQWFKDGILLSGQTNQAYSINKIGGSYTVSKVLNSCIGLQSAAAVISSSCREGILSEPRFSAPTVFPNPANAEISISVPTTDLAIVKIYNTKGEMIIEKYFNQMDNSIDVSQLENGLHFITISQNGVIEKKSVQVIH